MSVCTCPVSLTGCFPPLANKRVFITVIVNPNGEDVCNGSLSGGTSVRGGQISGDPHDGACRIRRRSSCEWLNQRLLQRKV